jgi:RecJ-like exonuclease
MPIFPKHGGNEVVHCPICSGTGRIYPLPLIRCDTPQNNTHEGFSGIDCPNCDGFGKIGSISKFTIENK